MLLLGLAGLLNAGLGIGFAFGGKTRPLVYKFENSSYVGPPFGRKKVLTRVGTAFFSKRRALIMIKNFRTLNHGVEFFRLCKTLCLERHLRDQLNRASASVVLNLGEGSGKRSMAEKRRYYDIAMGSLRECEAILILAEQEGSQAWQKLDCVGAHLYKLIKSTG
jgi:four helix bundle protein